MYKDYDLHENGKFSSSVSTTEPYFIASPNAKREDDGVVLVSLTLILV